MFWKILLIIKKMSLLPKIETIIWESYPCFILYPISFELRKVSLRIFHNKKGG